MKEWETGMAELRAHRTRESFRRKYGRSLGSSRNLIHRHGRAASGCRRRSGKRQSLHRLSRSTQEEWAAGVSQWVARREVERVNRRFRNALGLDRDYSTDEWRELHQEWQDRALMAKASKWLRHSKTGKTHSFAKRRMVASVGESVERSATLRDLRISERQADWKKPAPKAKPERERQASADHLATEASAEKAYTLDAPEEILEEKQVYASKDEERLEGFEEVREEKTIYAEPIENSSDGESDKQSVGERRKRKIPGFFFRIAIPLFSAVISLLYLCSLLNQRMDWDIPLGLDLMGIDLVGTREAQILHIKKEDAVNAGMGESHELFSKIELVPSEDGKPFTIPNLDLVMLWCPSGTFQMGSPLDEVGRRDDETPHTVTLTKGFWLGKYEVTQFQWEEIMGNNPSNFNAPSLPVEEVSWMDVTAFCLKLTELERKADRLPAGMAYQLPTEAQWEYACRAETKTAFSFGNSLTTRQANISGWPGETTVVGEYPSSAWGFYDMHGNVWEWCADYYGEYPRGTVRDPVGPENGSERVLRGGSWDYSIGNARSADRNRYGPAFSNYSLGFRLSLQTIGK